MAVTRTIAIASCCAVLLAAYMAPASAEGIVNSTVFASGSAFGPNGVPVGSLSDGSRNFDCPGSCTAEVPFGTRFGLGGDYFTGQASAQVDGDPYRAILSVAGAADVTSAITQPWIAEQGYEATVQTSLFSTAAPGSLITLHLETSFDYGTEGAGTVSGEFGSRLTSNRFGDLGVHDITYVLPTQTSFLDRDGQRYYFIDTIIAKGDAGVSATYGTPQHASFGGYARIEAFDGTGAPIQIVSFVPEMPPAALLFAGLLLLGFTSSARWARAAPR